MSSIKLDLYRSMIQIRTTEELIAEKYKDQEMRTAVHLGTGQEAPAAAVGVNLRPGDVVFSHHRAHNHFLASGGTVFSLIAELHGSQMGCSRGRGGSVHLTHSNKVFFASNAILGESIALATGSALGIKMLKKKNIAVSFFGDAAWEEGVTYESLNFASIHSLPVLFICENNAFSTESPLHVRKSKNSEFINRAESFGVKSLKLDGNDVLCIQEIISELVLEMRENPYPVLVECETYRWREHVGPYFDHEVGRNYRSKEELMAWKAKDPIARLKKTIVDEGIVSTSVLDDLRVEIESRVKSEFSLGQNAPKPKPESLLEFSELI
jgi:TPP-dependent pyruvate/acetoin dehydrogenase alpha subunit